MAVRGEAIVIGGYFYDPFFGPYPWWGRHAYRPRYVPIYDYRAEVRVMATPKDAGVYIDGFYAGIVDDFDGVFQKLLLPPGGHSFVLYLEGFRTSQHNLYLRAGSTLKLHHTMEPLAAGERSVPPPVAPPVPAPPAGSYRVPRTPPPVVLSSAPSSEAFGFGTVEIRVQPVDAEVSIDGQRWVSSDPGHFVVQVAEGRHQVEVARSEYLRLSTNIDVRDGKTIPLNISLPPQRPDRSPES